MQALTVGDIARLTLTVADDSGNLSDPSTVALTIQSPTGTMQASPVRDGVGLYHYDLPLDVPGSYLYRWETSGGVAGVVEDGVYAWATLLHE